MSINLFPQSADRSAPAAASPAGPRSSAESAEGSVCSHFRPAGIRHQLFTGSIRMLGFTLKRWMWRHASFCWLWFGGNHPRRVGPAGVDLSAPQTVSPLSAHAGWEAFTARNALPDRINRDFFSHCHEIALLPRSRYRWDRGDKTHMHIALKSQPCPAWVVRVAVRGWCTLCAKSCLWPCRLLTSPDSVHTGQCRGNILICCRRQQWVFCLGGWHRLLDKALEVCELTNLFLAGSSASWSWNYVWWAVSGVGSAQVGSQQQCAAGMHTAFPRGCASAHPCVVAAEAQAGVWQGLISYCTHGGCGKGKCVDMQKAEEVAQMGGRWKGFCW